MHDAWYRSALPLPDERARQAALERQGQLTKPPGSLGRLESLAVDMAALQGREQPVLETIRIVVFAGDHGVASEGVSAFPQAVTTEMVRNFARGGAAISVLARELGATLEVVDVGTAHPPGPLPGVFDRRIAAGTRNFAHEPAMTEGQCEQALNEGREAVNRAREAGADLFIGGEMGIANTTSAAAVACALLDRPAGDLAGPGTGLDAEGVAHKARLIDSAVARYRQSLDSPLAVLQHLGGFEIAALAGAYVAAAQARLPVLVDGFISSVALLVASRLLPGVEQRVWFAHRSAEPGHQRVLEALGAEPLLDLGMRLGEGSGAAVAVPLLRQACALHGGMATFAEAGVSGSE